MDLASRTAPRWIALALLPCLLALPADALASGQATAADPVPKKVAKERLAHLGRLLRTSSSTSDEVKAALTEVADAYAHHGADARARDAFRKSADTQLAKALLRWKTQRGTDRPNLHEDAVVHAAQVIGNLASVLDVKGRSALAAKVRAALEDVLERRKPDDVSQRQLDASFAALGKLGDLRTLGWHLDQAAHTRSREIRALKAALAGLALYENLPGKARYQIADAMRRTWTGVESTAQQTSNSPQVTAKKRLWDEVRVLVIPLMQRVTGAPRAEDGTALATMADFAAWMRDHKSVHKAPWTD